MSKIVFSKFASLIICIILLAVTLTIARSPAALFFFQKGVQAKQDWQLEKAKRYFSWASWLKSDDAETQLEKGLNLQMRGEFLSAQKEFEELLKEPVKNKVFQAKLLNALGINHFNFNEADKALEFHQKSLDIARNISDKQLQAQALIHLSRVLYYSKGQGDEALEKLLEALELAREIKDEISEADALRNAGAIYNWHKGERERPLKEFYFPALEIYKRNRHLQGVAVTLSNISLVYRAKGEAFQFLKFQTESLAIKEEIGDQAGLCDSNLYLSWYYINLQNYRKAREFITKSLEISRLNGYKIGQNEAEASIVVIYIELKEFDNAIELLEELLERDRANPILYKYRLGYLGFAHRLKGEPIIARKYFEQAYELNKKAGNESEVNMLNKIAETFQDTGEWEKAEELLTKAEEIGLQENERNWLYWFENRKLWARQLTHFERHEEALKYLLEATEIETKVIGSNESSPIQGQSQELYDQIFLSIFENVADSKTEDKLIFQLFEKLRYRAFKNLIVRVSDPQKTSETLKQKEKTALKQLVETSEKLKTDEYLSSLKPLRIAYSKYEDAILQTQLNEPNYKLLREARPVEPEVVQKALDEETAIIEYLYTDEKVLALVITRKGLKSVELPVTKTNLFAKVKLFRSLIFDSNTEHSDWIPVAKDLHRSLIAPLEQKEILAKNIHKIGFVPFGFLRDLPFAALVQEDKKFLIEKYTIFHLPSATFLTKSSPQINQSKKTILSLGRNKSDEADLPTLNFAEEEAVSISKIFDGETLTNNKANETEFKKIAPNFKYIHIATHAVSEEMLPLLSRLKLNATDEDDGNLTIREIFNLRLETELVTLGACRTGQSFSSSGNKISDVDRISLFEAFLHAGSQSVLATLLPIEDHSTPAFMKSFYTNLKTKNKAESLAETQRAAIEGKISFSANNQNHQLKHPRQWATFILYGDYR